MSNARSNHSDDFPYWLVAAILCAIGAIVSVVTSDDSLLIFKIIARGIWTTIFVTLVAFSLACIFGLLLSLGSSSRFIVLRQTCRFYIEIVRGIPLLVLLFYIAFVGAPMLIALANWMTFLPQKWGWMDAIIIRDFPLIWRAIMALMIAYSAFIAEIFRAGFQSVDIGQHEAAWVLGVSRWHKFRFVVFPQAMRVIMPPLSNDFISMIKDSALVSVLGVADITQMGKVYAAGSFKFFETYNIVAMIYLLMTVTLSLALRRFERKLTQDTLNTTP